VETAANTQELQQTQRDAVLWLKLNRPQALNSLTASLVDALTRAIENAQCDPTMRVIVLTGEGRAFCAGADLKASAVRSPESGAEFVKAIGALTELIEACPLPVIAAINGIAVAGGLELVLACDPPRRCPFELCAVSGCGRDGSPAEEGRTQQRKAPHVYWRYAPGQ
jgi:enoyl-CoA hydratase/carnithine racemase